MSYKEVVKSKVVTINEVEENREWLSKVIIYKTKEKDGFKLYMVQDKIIATCMGDIIASTFDDQSYIITRRINNGIHTIDEGIKTKLKSISSEIKPWNSKTRPRRFQWLEVKVLPLHA